MGGTPAFHTRSESNAVKRLPKELAAQVKSVMHAADKRAPKDGITTLSQQAKWLQTEHSDVAVLFLEGLGQTFTVNRMNLGQATGERLDAAPCKCTFASGAASPLTARPLMLNSKRGDRSATNAGRRHAKRELIRVRRC